MGTVRSCVKASMFNPEYCESAIDSWFASGIEAPVLEAAGTLDFYIAYDAGGPLDNASVQ